VLVFRLRRLCRVRCLAWHLWGRPPLSPSPDPRRLVWIRARRDPANFCKIVSGPSPTPALTRLGPGSPLRKISSERFANFIAQLDLRGKRVVDVGTGTGILAIAAAHAGSEIVIATDINPNAALSVRDNALRNGAGPRVTAVCMDLLSGFVPLPTFDVIISNRPKHAKEPRDLADRGWHAGPNHRDVAALFTEAYERLRPGGRLYVMFSSDSELDLIDTLIERAGFRSRVVKRYSIFIESFVLYECMRASDCSLGTSGDARSLTPVPQCDLNLPADRRGI
jgi:SAM-dependent methyltransferase